MKRCWVLFGIVALYSAVLRADVTVTTTSTMEGLMAAMLSNAGITATVRIKGSKSRADMEVMGQSFASITDLSTKRVIMLRPSEKTAQIIRTPEGQVNLGPIPFTMPKMGVSLEPTARTQEIDGHLCNEFTYSIAIEFGQMMGSVSSQMPKEAIEMMKDVKISTKGFMWVANDIPGAAEYKAFQQKAIDANLLFASAGSSMQALGGLNEMMQMLSKQPGAGIPYLTQVEMNYEGTGPAVDMLRQMGTLKISTKITELSTATVSDDVFEVPSDYTFINNIFENKVR